MADKINNKKPLTLGQLMKWLSWMATVVLVLIALSSRGSIHLHFFSYSFSVPFALIVIVSLVAGFFSGISDYLALGRENRQEQIKGQWQVQDAKLAANVISDREKQLEAKITTLEAALDKALKKTS